MSQFKIQKQYYNDYPPYLNPYSPSNPNFAMGFPRGQYPSTNTPPQQVTPSKNVNLANRDAERERRLQLREKERLLRQQGIKGSAYQGDIDMENIKRDLALPPYQPDPPRVDVSRWYKEDEVRKNVQEMSNWEKHTPKKEDVSISLNQKMYQRFLEEINKNKDLHRNEGGLIGKVEKQYDVVNERKKQEMDDPKKVKKDYFENQAYHQSDKENKCPNIATKQKNMPDEKNKGNLLDTQKGNFGENVSFNPFTDALIIDNEESSQAGWQTIEPELKIDSYYPRDVDTIDFSSNRFNIVKQAEKFEKIAEPENINMQVETPKKVAQPILSRRKPSMNENVADNTRRSKDSFYWFDTEEEEKEKARKKKLEMRKYAEEWKKQIQEKEEAKKREKHRGRPLAKDEDAPKEKRSPKTEEKFEKKIDKEPIVVDKKTPENVKYNRKDSSCQTFEHDYSEKVPKGELKGVEYGVKEHEIANNGGVLGDPKAFMAPNPEMVDYHQKLNEIMKERLRIERIALQERLLFEQYSTMLKEVRAGKIPFGSMDNHFENHFKQIYHNNYFSLDSDKPLHDLISMNKNASEGVKYDKIHFDEKKANVTMGNLLPKEEIPIEASVSVFEDLHHSLPHMKLEYQISPEEVEQSYLKDLEIFKKLHSHAFHLESSPQKEDNSSSQEVNSELVFGLEEEQSILPKEEEYEERNEESKNYFEESIVEKSQLSESNNVFLTQALETKHPEDKREEIKLEPLPDRPIEVHTHKPEVKDRPLEVHAHKSDVKEETRRPHNELKDSDGEASEEEEVIPVEAMELNMEVKLFDTEEPRSLMILEESEEEQQDQEDDVSETEEMREFRETHDRMVQEIRREMEQAKKDGKSRDIVLVKNNFETEKELYEIAKEAKKALGISIEEESQHSSNSYFTSQTIDLQSSSERNQRRGRKNVKSKAGEQHSSDIMGLTSIHSVHLSSSGVTDFFGQEEGKYERKTKSDKEVVKGLINVRRDNVEVTFGHPIPVKSRSPLLKKSVQENKSCLKEIEERISKGRQLSIDNAENSRSPVDRNISQVQKSGKKDVKSQSISVSKGLGLYKEDEVQSGNRNFNERRTKTVLAKLDKLLEGCDSE